MAVPNSSPSLDQLHDLVVPGPVSWWPPAVGWYCVGAILTVAFFVVAWHLQRRWRRNAYRRLALAELKSLSQQCQDGSLAAAVSELLKRTALVTYPRPLVASLSGDEWLRFLDQSAGITVFTSSIGQTLTSAAYDSTAVIDQNAQVALLEAARHWIRQHHAMTDRESPKC